MKLKLPLIAAFVAIISLTACGGSDSKPAIAAESPAALTQADTVVGTGAEAVAGKNVWVYYTGYLYTASKTDFKGTQFGSLTSGDGFKFAMGTTSVIPGFQTGITGMKVGGKRTIIIPAAQAFGASGSGDLIPPNSGLVFDVELRAVGPGAESPDVLTKTDTVVGTGAVAEAPKTVQVYFTGYLYTTSKTDFKGTVFQTLTSGTPFSFKLGTNAVIPGFETGVTGMKVGGKRTVIIPAAQAYGATGKDTIPPFSGVVFDIELKEAL